MPTIVGNNLKILMHRSLKSTTVLYMMVIPALGIHWHLNPERYLSLWIRHIYFFFLINRVSLDNLGQWEREKPEIRSQRLDTETHTSWYKSTTIIIITAPVSDSGIKTVRPTRKLHCTCTQPAAVTVSIYLSQCAIIEMIAHNLQRLLYQIIYHTNQLS